MRDFVLFQAEAVERSRPFPLLRRLISNWRKRRHIKELEQLDDHVLNDIGLTRADIQAVLTQPLSVDPFWELERQASMGRRARSPAGSPAPRR